MRSFPKGVTIVPLSLAVIAALVAGAFAQKKDDDKPRAKDKKEDAKKPDPTPGAPDATPKATKMDIPVTKDHDAKGLKIQYRDGNGKKQMDFTIGTASYIDADHVGLMETQVETFDEDGKHEMNIDLPKSVLEVPTNIITTKKHVEIKRADFTLTGEAMEFNMKTKQGTLGGGVRMLIYNIDDEVKAAPAAADAPATPAPKTP